MAISSSSSEEMKRTPPASAVISSELEELMAMCDRILVMSRGEIVGEFARGAFSEEAILHAAFREGVAAS